MKTTYVVCALYKNMCVYLIGSSPHTQNRTQPTHACGSHFAGRFTTTKNFLNRWLWNTPSAAEQRVCDKNDDSEEVSFSLRSLCRLRACVLYVCVCLRVYYMVRFADIS